MSYKDDDEHEITVAGNIYGTIVACRCGEPFRQHGALKDGLGQLLAWLYFHASDEQRAYRQLAVNGAVSVESCQGSPGCVNGPLWHLVAVTCAPLTDVAATITGTEHVHEWPPFHDENGQQSCACGAIRRAGIEATGNLRAAIAEALPGDLPGSCRGNGECTC